MLCSCSTFAQTRDFARFGWLYLNQGKSPLTGDQLVPAQWVVDSVTPDAPHLQPGRNNLSDYPFGYGYQWWIPEPDAALGPRGEFMALGIYGQSIFVSPADGIVVARNAAWPAIKDASAAIHMFEQTAALSRAIAVQFAAL
jgi:CubicO group peptidase (beta-lactamase class C family)